MLLLVCDRLPFLTFKRGKRMLLFLTFDRGRTLLLLVCNDIKLSQLVCNRFPSLMFDKGRGFLFITFKNWGILLLLVYGNVKFSCANRRLLLPFLFPIRRLLLLLLLPFPISCTGIPTSWVDILIPFLFPFSQVSIPTSWVDILTPMSQVIIFFPVMNHGMTSSLESTTIFLGPLSQTTVLGLLSQLWILHGFSQSSQILNGIWGTMIDGTHQQIACFRFQNYFCTDQKISCCTHTCTTLSKIYCSTCFCTTLSPYQNSFPVSIINNFHTVN